MKILLFILLSLDIFCQNDGTIFQNITIGGSHASWNNPSSVSLSDNIYSISNNSLTNNQYTDYIQVTGFNFTLPANAIINGIEVYSEAFDTGAILNRAMDNKVRIVKNGVIQATDRSLGPNWNNTDLNNCRIYGSNTDLWGQVWTYSDINNIGFGVAISGKRVGGGGSTCIPTIDHIYIIVYWSYPIPITLLYFKGFIKDGLKTLTWETSSESNNDYFLLEGSINALNFNTIAEIKGQNIHYKYSINDRSDNNYYRLSQVDYDGVKTIYSIVYINSEVHFNVYPNPTNDYFNIETDQPFKAYLLDNNGRYLELLEKRFTTDIGIHILIIEIENKLFKIKIIKY